MMGGPALGQRANDRSMMWYLDENENLRIMPVQTGVTDGKNTEIMALFGDIEEGMKIIGSVQGEPADISKKQSSRMPMGGLGPRRM